MGDRAGEIRVALEAVRAACRACRAVQQRLAGAALEKADRSPVTVADFAAQAIICQRLGAAFPGDAVVGEEGSATLRGGEAKALLAQVAAFAGAEAPGADAASVLDWIDRGGADGGSERYWALDPVDGTKGFLRGEQFAVALALVEAGEVVLGVLGCPSLPQGEGASEAGALFSALRGGGARVHRLWDAADAGRAIAVSQTGAAAQARFCESVEAAHSNQEEAARIAARLGIRRPPLRMDSQCKYAAVARGDAEIYLRLPTSSAYREKIWDHAAGALLVEEAGGRVSDARGRRLDFRQGRHLQHNHGVVATCGALHEQVLRAIC